MVIASVPAHRLIMFWVYLTTILVILITFAFIAKRLTPLKANVDGKHVVVTGGSSGIGKSIAKLVVERGANVTILARNKLRLEEAKTELQQHLRPDRKVQCVSVDLSGDYEPVAAAIREVEEKAGPVYMLINSAGTSISRAFVDLKPDDFKKLMEANYYSAVNATKACVPSMVKQRGGRVVLLSSQAGQIGLFGFSAYSASKFALRGFAEALQMEMTPHNIRVTVAYPADTDTPGFQHEQQGKPQETKLISETAGLFKAEDVAKIILDDSQAGVFSSYMGMDGWLLANNTAGMSPATGLLELITQFFLMGISRVIGVVYLLSFDSIVLKCKKEKDAKPKSS